MFKFDSLDTNSRPKLPDSIKIDDITSGRIDPQLIYNEIERLKAEINILRNDMSMFLQALATILEDNSPQEYYRTTMSRLETVQESIQEYCERYNKLLPIINLAQIKLGHEVEAPPVNKAKPIQSQQSNKVKSSAKVLESGAQGQIPNFNQSTASNGNGNASRNTKKPTKKGNSTNKISEGTSTQPIVI
ncbi:hypothetical protein FOB58_004809 [Candida parapsilosis]|uniref:Uncharacterized protein n=1 Tax=Candida parapsilosis TaxID=5480 RepID=A0A8X7T9P5_CANPA|nr:hypothetical protein FOB58_004809 [Candida parapsilosis]KAF6045091.1 hypothetical protein FOB59_004567 [Candida parapsilosis]KAF6048764.1 hypothetical protein FOB60_004148 [Candida parapsilosis]KAF6060765.1 hypothetical protein FOB61_004774 [Candida parapsilosis]